MPGILRVIPVSLFGAGPIMRRVSGARRGTRHRLLSMRRRMAALLASGALVLTVAGCAPTTNASPASPASPATLTVTGEMTVGAGSMGTAGGPCTADPAGLDDIHSGTSVVLRDSAGKTVALGSLQAGVYAPLPGPTVALNCTFPFSLTDVPAGDRFYSIEVANRGQVNETEKNITAPIHLNIQGNSAP
jgi:hypothetical protein